MKVSVSCLVPTAFSLAIGDEYYGYVFPKSQFDFFEGKFPDRWYARIGNSLHSGSMMEADTIDEAIRLAFGDFVLCDVLTPEECAALEARIFEEEVEVPVEPVA